MQALLTSLAVVAIGEIGDKTQLLALMLAARFRRPWPIILGILASTLFNHALAALVGEWIRNLLNPDILRWLLGISFIAVGIWALVPDKLDDEAHKGDDAAARKGPWGIFAVTFVAFFLAEIGDKTQFATVMLAARFDSLLAVVSGTTLGMLIADVPAVLVGSAAANRLPLHVVRRVAAAIFIALGISALIFGVHTS